MRKEDFFSNASSPKKKLNIGDRVRFLNNVGGGVVTAFHGKDQVLVEDENGFDVPVLIVECVVIGEADRRMVNKEPEPYVPPVKKDTGKASVAGKAAGAPVPKESTFEETPQGERLNLSLAFLPVDPRAFMQTSFESYLINESNYYLYFNYMSCKNNSWTSRSHGLIEPDTKIFIEDVEKPVLNELEHICVQVMAFKEGKPFSLKNTVSVELRPDTVKFYKLHCFTKNDFFDEDALILPLISNDVPEKQLLVSATDIREAMYEKKKEERPAVRKIKPANQTLEVDLHINQLLETTSGMDHAAILNCQMSRFHEVMKANAGKKGQKIVFIHGKGEGVLRAALEKELKTTYKHQSRFQDASFREYGFGATMVTII
ncbi:MAG: DUF2027 domain-containing protein [Tannerella sp.]|jgi:hypothetical protein|nr:DUF2027 domain-containing protein [Tannerella sp.]